MCENGDSFEDMTVRIEEVLRVVKLSRRNCPVPDELNVWTAPMPTTRFVRNDFYSSVGYLMGVVLSVSFLFPVSRLVKSLVEEKETHAKRTLLVAGVEPWAHWWSWYAFELAFFTIAAGSVTICKKH